MANLFLWLRQLSLVEIDRDGLIKVCGIDKARDSGPLLEAYFKYEQPTH